MRITHVPYLLQQADCVVVETLLTLLVIVNGFFLVSFAKDVRRHWAAMLRETGNPVAMAVSSFLLYFFSTFGISDFAIGTVLYRKLKWVSDELLPGTLNTECVIPIAVMAFVYISSIEVDTVTLLVSIGAQMLGAYLGPRYVTQLRVEVIKRCIAAGLVLAASLILMSKWGLFPGGGEATGLTGGKLVLLGMLSFVYGGLNNVSIGSYPLTMGTAYALGLSPAVIFPIMMGACTFSVSVGSMEFIRLKRYSRKITLFASTIGSCGVLTAALLVTNLNISMLQWVAAAVMFYSAGTMIWEMVNQR